MGNKYYTLVDGDKRNEESMEIFGVHNGTMGWDNKMLSETDQ